MQGRVPERRMWDVELGNGEAWCLIGGVKHNSGSTLPSTGVIAKVSLGCADPSATAHARPDTWKPSARRHPQHAEACDNQESRLDHEGVSPAGAARQGYASKKDAQGK